MFPHSTSEAIERVIISTAVPVSALKAPLSSQIIADPYSPSAMRSNQYGETSPRVGTFTRISSRKDSNFATTQDYLNAKLRHTESDPRIIITPVNEEYDQLNNSSVLTPRQSTFRSSPYSPKKVGLKRHVSVLLGRAINKDDPLGGGYEGSNKVEDPLKRKTVFSSRVRTSRSSQGRLLSILARQAVVGRNTDVSKVFLMALVRMD